jgi:hypothetical protein
MMYLFSWRHDHPQPSVVLVAIDPALTARMGADAGGLMSQCRGLGYTFHQAGIYTGRSGRETGGSSGAVSNKI